MTESEQEHFGEARLVVASNRGPLSIDVTEDGEDKISRGSGGLVSGMQSALIASPHAVWICAAMNERERAIAKQVDGGRLSEVPAIAEALAGDFDVAMQAIDPQTFRYAYNGIANSTLWFLLHMLYAPARTPIFDMQWRRQWSAYDRFNRSIADAIAREAADGATVMVQDYHLLLVPRMLRDLRPDLRIGHFTHTPWVSPDYFRMLPDDVARALLDGMMGADLLGFHTRGWADQFAACCADVLGEHPGGRLRVFGLTTDIDQIRERGGRRDVEAAMRKLRDTVGDRKLISRVDRTELSKNVFRGLLAYRELLRRWPHWRGKVVHAVFDYPSREDVPEYREYIAAVERLAQEIDDEFGDEDWAPLILEIRQDYPAALASLRMADVVFVNPVRDGMNLVVLEGVVLSDGDPTVVLSRTAGAADLLGDDALLINPFDINQTADALHHALSMPDAQRSARAKRLRQAAGSLPPDDWFQAQLDALGT